MHCRLARFVCAVLFATVTPAASQTPSTGAVTGRIIDPSGAVVPKVTVRATHANAVEAVETDASGQFVFNALPPGRLRIIASANGFADRIVDATVTAGDRARVDITLDVESISEAVHVVPERVVSTADAPRRIPGSLDVFDLALLENSRVLTTAEVLRKAPGVHVRDEEGFGLRPNIGVRGLNPTRSSRVLLLEDGIPLTYAPYGDNAAYYHPPIERFERIEILKGAGQIAYGPMTVGGVINYVTPAPPGSSQGQVTATIGSRDYFNAQGGWGTTVGRTGIQIDFMRKQGDGARENISSELNDITGKLVTRLTDRQVVTLRGSYYSEDSNITYSGLRLDEYQANPRQNPFRNDFFYVDRYGASVTHTLTLSSRIVATTNVYFSNFRRHWWRQSSNSSQRPNDAADSACGGMANLNTTCGNEGRLRQYAVWGVEPRVRMIGWIGPISSETEVGARAHFENQDRRQENGVTPTARSGVLVESNERTNDAYAAFIQNRFTSSGLTVTPGVRVEHVGYERTNRLLSVSGDIQLTEVIPGIGATYGRGGRYTFFAGVHRGFTPPRTEDVIDNTTGGSIDLAPERSWNYEVGMRAAPVTGLRAEATFFRMDYENQIIPASLAGGIGSTLTNGGETRHQGIEMSVRSDSGAWSKSRHNVYVQAAYTWLPTAEFAGMRFSGIPGFSSVSVSGNRLPYAPEHLMTMGMGYTHARGWDVNAEAVLLGRQFGDDLNTIESTPDGQRGLLTGYTLWNATANYPVKVGTLFVAVKNIFDRTEIVDRSRGILPTSPRTLQAGLKVRF